MTLDADIHAGLALLPAKMSGDRALVMLHAINRQENPTRVPRQLPNGPAVGDFQFEKGGGIRGVLTHGAVSALARQACHSQGVAFDADAIYAALQVNPVLAAALARLLLWTDPKPLPAVGDVSEAWALYLRVWRPGAAARDYEGLRKKWSVNYAHALEAIGA